MYQERHWVWQGVPSWYTKVSFHTRWIKCIIERSFLFENHFEEVQNACKKSVSKKQSMQQMMTSYLATSDVLTLMLKFGPLTKEKIRNNKISLG